MMQTLANDFARIFRPRTGAARIVGIALFVLAALSSLAALSVFPTDAPSGWLPYLTSTVLFIAACYVLFPGRRVEPAPPPLTPAVVGFGIAIVILAAVLRFYRLDVLPFGTWRDEADISMAAKHILNDPTFRPIFVPNNLHPMHLYALVAFVFSWIGVGTYGIRVVTALFGIGTVVIAFYTGRELYGNRFGLILAFLFAVSRWHITFSRFGIPGITAPFFEMLTLWLWLRAERTRHIHDFAWAGMAFGYGLNFYTAFRLFTVVMAALVLRRLIAWWRATSRQPAHGTALAVHLSAFAIAAAFAVAPLAQFALLNPEILFGYSRDISIFNRRDEPDLTKAILSTTSRHLLMFNYSGDRNGRHNLPGEPMLDPMTGTLFVLGAAFAIRRWRAAPNFAFILVFVTGLSAGIFALDFEAPQSNRAIGSIAAAMYFAALAAETLWRAADSALPKFSARARLVGALALAAGGYTAYYNAHTYFVRQANSDDVWEAFNGIETLTAFKMLEAGPDRTTYYASMYLFDHEVVRFLAPNVHARGIIPPLGLPIHEPGDKQVMIFVDNANLWIIDEAHQYYPEAKFETFTTPNGRPVLYTATIQPESIRKLQGLTARYWRGDATQGEATFTRTELTLNTEWPAEAPLPAPFFARWEGVLYAPTFGDYEFILQSPTNAALWIDEQQIANGPSEQRVTVTLARGNHALRVEAGSGEGAARLKWRPPANDVGVPTELDTISNQWLYLSPPVFNNGLLGTYYPSPDWSGLLAFQNIDPFLDTYFHIIPLSRPYTIQWEGQIDAPTGGDYAFGLRVQGKAKLFIDAHLVVDAPEPTEYTEGMISLTQGRHTIRVEFLDDIGGSRIHLSWRPPGATEPMIVPSTVLWPYPSR